MEQSKIWSRYQSFETPVDVFRHGHGRNRYVAAQIGAPKKVLNIGVGRGHLEQTLVELGHDVYCVDPSAEAIERMAKLLGKDDRAKVAYAASLPFAASEFDAVVMIEVLEHLDTDEAQAALAEICRVLRPAGSFFGTVPADENLRSAECTCPKCGSVFHRWGHVRSFSKEVLAASLRRHFRGVRVRRCFFASADVNWKGSVVSLLKSVSVRVGLRGANESLFFRADRPSGD